MMKIGIKLLYIAVALAASAAVDSSSVYAQSHDEIVAGFKSSMVASCYGSNVWVEHSSGGDNALYVSNRNASLVFTPWMIQCPNIGTTPYGIGQFKLDNTLSVSGGTTFSATANKTDFNVIKGPDVTLAPPSGGWPTGSHYLYWYYDFMLGGFWNSRMYGGVIYVEDYANSASTASSTPSPVTVGKTVTFNYTLNKTGAYAASSSVKYYFTGKSASGSSTTPAGTKSVTVGGTQTVSSTYVTTATDIGTDKACQTLYYSPKSATDSGWGSKQVCATVQDATPWEVLAETTATGYETKAGSINVPTGATLNFNHTLKTNGVPVVDTSGTALSVKGTVYSYVRGGTKTDFPDKISKMKVEDEVTTSSTAADFTFLAKATSVNIADLERGKTYCQFVRSSRHKQGLSNTAQSTPICVYIPCVQ